MTRAARIRHLIFGLEHTLARRGQLYPHVPEALEALGRFRCRSGAALRLGLVDDSRALPAGAGAGRVRTHLRQLGLAALFPRPSEQVLVSDSATPSREALEALLGRLKGAVDPAATLVLTGKASWVHASASRGMPVLRFARSARTERDFGDWAEAPLVVARRFFPGVADNLRIALDVFLEARHDLELVSVDSAPRGGLLSAVAKEWLPLRDKRLAKLQGVHVQLPVEVQVDMGKRPQAHVARPDPETLAEVVHHVLNLQQHGSIQETGGRLRRGVTHVVERGPRGRRRLVRRRYARSARTEPGRHT